MTRCSCVFIVALLLGLAPAAAAPALSRPELAQFQQAVAPLIEEARSVHDEVERRLQHPPRRPVRPDVEQIEEGLKALRATNRTLARLQGLIATADRLEPPPALRLPAVELLLGVQHLLVAARNVELYAISARPEYLQAARLHKEAAKQVIASYRARMSEIEREVAP